MENNKVSPINEDCAKDRFEEIIGNGTGLKFVLTEVQRVAPTDSTVLVLGETGSGKERIAEAIHKASTRRDRPFIKLNCAAIPFDLLKANCLDMRKAHSPEPSRKELAASKWLTVALSFWMR